MKKIINLSICAYLFSFFGFAIAATPKIVASIYPLQQIANAISGQNSDLVADSYLSPHQYAVKPDDARAVIDADIFLWGGEMMMPQLVRYAQLRQGVTITAATLPKIHLLKAEGRDLSHLHEKKHSGQKQTGARANFAYNPHLWLSTQNALVIADALADALIAKDPDNAERYRENLAKFSADVQTTRHFIHQQLDGQPVTPYFVFHDAYGYFEQEFGVKNSGIIRIHAGQTPKTRHLIGLKKQLASIEKACVFREPQFKSAIVDKLVADSHISVETLDPVGYSRAANSEHGYTNILRNIALKLVQCGH